jgi:hypothetical protein
MALQVRARPTKAIDKGPAPYTLGWIKKETRAAEKERASKSGGW